VLLLSMEFLEGETLSDGSEPLRLSFLVGGRARRLTRNAESPIRDARVAGPSSLSRPLQWPCFSPAPAFSSLSEGTCLRKLPSETLSGSRRAVAVMDFKTLTSVRRSAGLHSVSTSRPWAAAIGAAVSRART